MQGDGRERDEPRETELKLSIDAGRLEELRGAPLLSGAGSGRVSTLATTYFDTPDQRLRAAGVSFRVRREGRRRVQTLKGPASEQAAGLFDRAEWEWPIRSDTPDLDVVARTPLAPLFRDLGDALGPVFRLAVERTTFEVGAAGAEAELTIDAGEIAAGGRRAAVTELELELRRGDAADLFRLARGLAEAAPIRLGVLTKAERGYALLDEAAPPAVKAVPPAVERGMSVAEAFQAVARSCLHHLLVNEALLAGTRAPEVVHQMRVAIRRLRAAISLFKPVLADPRLEPLRAELRWLGNELGRARDLDVFIAKVVEPIAAERAGEPDIAEAARGYRESREAAYDDVLALLASRRFGLLTVDLAAWIETGDWLRGGESALRSGAVEDFAEGELARRHRKLRRRAKRIAELDPEARHRVRIEGKKLRYAAEFFAPVFAGKGAGRRRKAMLAALEELQEHLGDLNDAAVAEERLEAEAGDPILAALGERRREAGDASLKPALKAAKAYRAAEPFWGEAAR